ncbi:MAG: hypothetical protein WAL83_14370 [Arenicellales bacterium]|jgi:hypothetical protein
MTELTLSSEERDALIVLLEGHLPDMSYEIADTDRSTYRDQIKARRDLLKKILDDLKKSEP